MTTEKAKNCATCKHADFCYVGMQDHVRANADALGTRCDSWETGADDP